MESQVSKCCEAALMTDLDSDKDYFWSEVAEAPLVCEVCGLANESETPNNEEGTKMATQSLPTAIDVKIKSIVIQTLVAACEEITTKADKEERSLTDVEMASLLAMLAKIDEYSTATLALLKQMNAGVANG
jgi:hypothetical protein